MSRAYGATASSVSQSEVDRSQTPEHPGQFQVTTSLKAEGALDGLRRERAGTRWGR